MPDWAEERAREWADGWAKSSSVDPVPSLAALLRETWEGGLKAGTTREAEALHRADSLLAEVRRVVEEEACHWDHCTDTILRHLDKL